MLFLLRSLASLQRWRDVFTERRSVPFSNFESTRANFVCYFRRVWKGTKTRGFSPQSPQVAQARNMSIGEHRHCCATFKMYGKKTYRFCNLRKWKDFNKKQLTLPKMCVTSLPCGPGADLWPFHGFLWRRFSLLIFHTGLEIWVSVNISIVA